MPRPARFLAALLLCALPISLAGCDLFGSDTEKGTSLPPGPVLIASIGGGTDGLWVFDSKTLEPTPLVETEDPPLGVVSSPNHERWYTAWTTGTVLGGDARNALAALDPVERRITKRMSRPTQRAFRSPLLYEPVNDHLVVPNVDDTTQFFDAETLELVRERRIVDSNSGVVDAVVAEERGKIYFGVVTPEVGDQIVAYDPAERAITSTIPLAGLPLGLSDIALSPDERYVYATTWKDFSSPGTFYVVDLEAGETVFEGGPVGKKANLAVHPNGRSVYIDCPAGGGLDAVPTNRLTRFDVEARELEVFLDSGEDLGLGYEGLVTDQITMLPGGDAFVIRDPIPSEQDPSLFAVDAETGEVRATYTPPHEEDGSPKIFIRNLDVAIVPGQ
jgi:DNA-binding beta-propeller fold protein YncE